MSNLLCLTNYLKAEYKNPPNDFDNLSEFDTFRSLMNIRPKMPINGDFIKMQDEMLQEKTRQKGVVDILTLTPCHDNIYLWQGDITTLKIDAIVNAANSQMLGCFCPCHACIDNEIHTFSGVQLRLECAKFMQEQGHLEPTGSAKITPGYNLPSKYVLHTVGPIINGDVLSDDKQLLASCYRSCLELAEKNNIKSIALCCISTGEFHFPNQLAAEISVHTVHEYLMESKSEMEVVFNVFKEYDKQIYEKLLSSNSYFKTKN